MLGHWGTDRKGRCNDMIATEIVFEHHRPSHQLSRTGNVYMTTSIDAVERFSEYSFIYQVEPIGQVDKHDVCWFEDAWHAIEWAWATEEIITKRLCRDRRLLTNEKLKDLARAYWSGMQHPKPRKRCVWEYIAKRARVVAKVKELEFI